MKLDGKQWLCLKRACRGVRKAVKRKNAPIGKIEKLQGFPQTPTATRYPPPITDRLQELLDDTDAGKKLASLYSAEAAKAIVDSSKIEIFRRQIFIALKTRASRDWLEGELPYWISNRVLPPIVTLGARKRKRDKGR
jgi:hypothetical protein